jgi:TonB family protein
MRIVPGISLLLLFARAIAAQPAAPPPTNTALAQAGLAALNRGQFTTAVYFLKQVVDKEPRHPSAWTQLGRAYFALDQVDAAIDAHLKQIDVNPECPGVYENLGLALMRKGMQEEAMEAFKQQVQVDPQNFAAHVALGNLYYDLQKYPEAVAELEKAVAIRPENVSGQIRLGEAYLGAGQTEKGLTILDKAVQDRSSPLTWNAVAYGLASHKVQLGRAQQFAESAVTTEATTLRNAELDHITAATLRIVIRLAQDWDTLGWVHFQRGDPDEAAKFIPAAWSVNPTGEIGDHLGQLYQSRGQKREAIATYAQALAAPGPLPDTRRRLEALAGNAVPRVADPAATRTVNAGRLVPEKAAAEFYVAQSSVAAGAEVRFIGGDDKLRQFTQAVQAAVPAAIFPDATPTKLIRRVRLTCPGGGGECAVELQTAAAALMAELNSIPPDTHIPAGPGAEMRPGTYRIGGEVSAPVPIYRPEPDYSEKARKAKYQGTVVLYVEVDPSGHPRNIKVVRSLGLGLDEKAVEAVSRWEFRPGMKDGQPVTVAATIEVNFRLLKNPGDR